MPLIYNNACKQHRRLKMDNSKRTRCEVFSRSMGFIRPVSNFNIGKSQEFRERNTFKESNCLTTGERHIASLLKKAA